MVRPPPLRRRRGGAVEATWEELVEHLMRAPSLSCSVHRRFARDREGRSKARNGALFFVVFLFSSWQEKFGKQTVRPLPLRKPSGSRFSLSQQECTAGLSLSYEIAVGLFLSRASLSLFRAMERRRNFASFLRYANLFPFARGAAPKNW